MNKETARQESHTHSDGCTCLNCGTYCTGRFCPDCGQPTSTPARLNSKTFGKAFMTSVTRLSPGLFITTWTLLTRPWVVIRDYLRGKHTHYTPPFPLAIQVFFLCAILEAIISETLGLGIPHHESESTVNTSLIVKFMQSSQIARYLLFSIPLSLSIFIAFLPFGSRRFNIYEYTCASLYMTIPISIFAMIFNPVQNAGVGAWFICMFGFLFCYWIWGNFVLFKVFKVRKFWRKALMFLWFNTILFVLICLLSELTYLLRS